MLKGMIALIVSQNLKERKNITTCNLYEDFEPHLQIKTKTSNQGFKNKSQDYIRLVAYIAK